ncbi:MAG TPA: circadian clock protein KaiC [Mycobacteriales bacterium]|nr:circadian clock protein KaiC [Mycobacteriales bacterium]
MDGDRDLNGERAAAPLTSYSSAVGVRSGPSVEKLSTGIPGFDHVTMGGLPRRRTTLLIGPAGSAKTVFSGQFLAEGVRRGEPGVFVSFEEPAGDLRTNFGTLGWELDQWERDGLWAFVDASPVSGYDDVEHGSYNFESLAARIGHAVDATAAERVVLDSFAAVFAGSTDGAAVRMHLRDLVMDLRRMGLTVVMTAESTGDATDTISRYGVEEFVSDNVVILRNALDDEKRRRTVEVLKMRGAMHRKGEFPFTVLPGAGVVVIPLSVMSLTQQSSNERLPTGNDKLDEMTDGGFFRDSIVLISGATGTGKTLMVTEFVASGCESGERCLLFAFEESRDQIFRNARGWGRDFEKYERDGSLRLVATYPEVASLEDHLVEIKNEIESFRPTRFAIDSLSALERIGTDKGFREFIIGLTSFVKAERVAGLLTSTTSSLLGGASITEGHISTLTDAIILLRYVELGSAVRRGLAVLKMRGSKHDHDIREFTIDGSGMHIGVPFRNVRGILSGRNVGGELDDLSH